MANTPQPEPHSAHLVPEVSDRGFRLLPKITDSWGGTIRAYESSAGNGPHLWLTVTPSEKVGGDNEATVHLTVDQVRQLVDQLNWLADHHYQNDQP